MYKTGFVPGMVILTSKIRGILVDSNSIFALRSAAGIADKTRSTGMPPDMGPLRGCRNLILGTNGWTKIPKSTQFTFGTLRGGLMGAGADDPPGLSHRVMLAVPENEEAIERVTITDEAVRLASERELKTESGAF